MHAQKLMMPKKNLTIKLIRRTWVKQGVPCTNNGSNYVIIRASKALTLLFQSNPSYTGSMKRASTTWAVNDHKIFKKKFIPTTSGNRMLAWAGYNNLNNKTDTSCHKHIQIQKFKETTALWHAPSHQSWKTKANLYMSSQTTGNLGIHGRVSNPYATLLFYMLFHILGLLSSLTNLQLVQVSWGICKQEQIVLTCSYSREHSLNE